MLDYYEFATKLRNLARTIPDPEVYMPLVRLAEEYEARAEALEMEMIEQSQRDWVETHG
jgi:hypothetical protein